MVVNLEKRNLNKAIVWTLSHRALGYWSTPSIDLMFVGYIQQKRSFLHVQPQLAENWISVLIAVSSKTRIWDKFLNSWPIATWKSVCMGLPA